MTHDQIPLFAAAGGPPPAAELRAKPPRRRSAASMALPDAELPAALSLPLAVPAPASVAAGPGAAAAPSHPASPCPAVAATVSGGAHEGASSASMPMNPDASDMTLDDHDPTSPSQADQPAALRSDRLWQLDGWTARVIKNEDDDGWAVEMLQDGEAEPALVGPWTMGRDKKNPKPLDQAAFNTLVKTASEVLQRHRQQAHAMLHKRLTVFALDAQWDVRLDITPDEYEPYATLSAFNELGEEVAQVRVPPDFRLGVASATAWISGGFARPAQASRGFEGWSE